MNTTINLKDAIKKHTVDQDKIMSPEETVNNFIEKTKNLNLDILQETKRIDNGRLNIPVFFSICGADAKTVTGTNKQMGKGATPEQAKASAVMELAERFSFFSFANNPNNFFTDTYKNVEKDAIPFEMIMQSVHDTGDIEVNKKIFEHLPLKWTKAYNLTKKKEILVPFNWFYMINEFNGPSAGNCAEEAICQGISEVIERHTSSIISHESLKIPAIDPDSVTDPMVIEMLEKYKKSGVKVFISDFSLDTGIPTIGVLAYDPETFPVLSEIVWTAGTAPDPQKALSRALTETAQLAGDFNTKSNYVASGLPKFTELEKADFITIPEKTISIQDLPDISDNNIKTEVENEIDAIEKIGMEVLLINTMHKDLKIPAFYTIIPGAHFRERAVEASVGMFAARFITETFNPAEAINKLNEIDNLLPGKYYTQFYIGLSYISLENPVAAIPHFEKALKLDPSKLNIPDIISYLGVCLKDTEQYEKALDILQKGALIDDQRTDIFNLMGFCNFMLKNHETAIANFKKVIEIDPSSAIDYANVASNYRDLGNKELAIKFYKLALTIDPSITFAKDNLNKLRNGN